MLILLPPSETKRPGGRALPLDLGTLALPQLAPQRAAVIEALAALSADEDAAARADGYVSDITGIRHPAYDAPTVVVPSALTTAVVTVTAAVTFALGALPQPLLDLANSADRFF